MDAFMQAMRRGNGREAAPRKTLRAAEGQADGTQANYQGSNECACMRAPGRKREKSGFFGETHAPAASEADARGLSFLAHIIQRAQSPGDRRRSHDVEPRGEGLLEAVLGIPVENVLAAV